MWFYVCALVGNYIALSRVMASTAAHASFQSASFNQCNGVCRGGPHTMY